MRRSHVAAVAAVALVGLSGCGGGDEPAESSSSTVSPRAVTETGSPGGTESGGSEPAEPSESSGESTAAAEPPAAAMENTKAGAEAFAEWYMVQIGEALRLASSEILAAYAGPECDTCARYVEIADDRAEQGWKANKNPFTVSLDRSRTVSDATGIAVALDVTEARYKYVDSAGEEHQVEAPEYPEFRATATLAWVDSDWQVVYLVRTV